MSGKQGHQKSGQDRRRRLQTVGALVTATVLTGVLAWALVVQGPDGSAGNEPSEADASTGQSTTDDAARSGSQGGSPGALQQSSSDPSPKVSNVPLGPGAQPEAVDEVEELPEAEAPDTVPAPEVRELEAQAEAMQEQSADDEQKVVAEIEDYLAQEESSATIPDGAEEAPEPDAIDPGLSDDLEADVQTYDDELGERLSGVLDDVQP